MIPEYGSWEVILPPIGVGNYGSVYKIQKKDFDHVYQSALKVISIPKNPEEVEQVRRGQSLTQEELEAYFYDDASKIVKEFEIMSKLKGITNIVSYQQHEIRQHKDGIGWDIYIEMELLTPLDQYIDMHPMTCRDVIQLGIDLCTALERCQKYRIIHRDIKPSNIFVSEQGDFKLGDFGIARILEKRSSMELSKRGTVPFMAPEIYRGEEYDFSVDLYSLGIVLYKLLNFNRYPFMPNYPAKQTREDMNHALARRFRGDKLPYPAQDHSRLADIVLKACSFDPRLRYSSPTAMKRDLEAILYQVKELDYVLGVSDRLVMPKEQTPSGSPSDISGLSNRQYPPDEIEQGESEKPTEKLEQSEEATALLSTPDKGIHPKRMLLVIGTVMVILVVAAALFFFGRQEEIPSGEPSGSLSQSSGELQGEEGSQSTLPEAPLARVETETGDAGYTLEKEYDSAGNLIRETQYHADGTLGFTYLYTYDEDNRQLSETVKRADGEIWTSSESTYNSDGLLEQKTHYERGVLLMDYELHTWNADGTEAGYTLYTSYDAIAEVHTFSYQEDGTYTDTVTAGKGIVLSQSTDLDGNSVQIVKTILNYDVSGQMVKQSDYDAEDQLVEYCEIKYDYRFRQTKQSWYWGDGSVYGHAEYEYDEDGSTTKLTEYDASGAVTVIVVYEIGPEGNVTVTYFDKDESIIAEAVYDETGNQLQQTDYTKII